MIAIKKQIIMASFLIQYGFVAAIAPQKKQSGMMYKDNFRFLKETTKKEHTKQ
jgi:hypothetical protein